MAPPERAISGAAPTLLSIHHKADVSPSGFLPKCKQDWPAKFSSCPQVWKKQSYGNNKTKEGICVNVFAWKSTRAALQVCDPYEKAVMPKNVCKLLSDILKHI